MAYGRNGVSPGKFSNAWTRDKLLMAINAIDYAIYRELSKSKQIPPHPDILEIGEANWYGDVEITRLAEDIGVYANSECRLDLLKKLKQLVENSLHDPTGGIYFDIAKVFYKTFLDYRSIASIDLDGTENALRYDLNIPLPLENQYHVLINTGTAEHVFNIYQFFKTVHERTYPGGLMVHAFPFTGWLDHGFYNFSPTFVADLASANRYQMLSWVYGELLPTRVVQLKSIEQVHAMDRNKELGLNSLQYVVLRKPPQEVPFDIPMQGVYSCKVSDQTMRDWYQMR